MKAIIKCEIECEMKKNKDNYEIIFPDWIKIPEGYDLYLSYSDLRFDKIIKSGSSTGGMK